ncbi:MAG: hypothetical protein ACK4S3_07420, partial [Parvibaculum sp.]
MPDSRRPTDDALKRSAEAFEAIIKAEASAMPPAFFQGDLEGLCVSISLNGSKLRSIRALLQSIVSGNSYRLPPAD